MRDITVDPNDTEIVVAIINMARSLDRTSAEGWDRGQLALSALQGLPRGQGFYFSPPLKSEAF